MNLDRRDFAGVAIWLALIASSWYLLILVVKVLADLFGALAGVV